MRLRYLNLRDAPPLQQLAIPFGQESILGRACAIRFVVGVNGSGKSRLLQALAQIFLSLERVPNVQLPFYVTLVYDLGKEKEEKRTIFVQYQPQNETDNSPKLQLIEYDWLPDDQTWDWEQLPEQVPDEIKKRHFDGSSGTIGSFLPQALLAYTSGETHVWKTIFTPPPPLVEIPAIGDVEERPVGWNVERERQYLRQQELADAADNLSEIDAESLGESGASRLGYFIAPEQLRLAVCAVTLLQAAQEFRHMATPEAEAVLLARWDESSDQSHSQSGLRNLLNEVGWRYPVTFGIRLNFEPDQWLGPDTMRIRKLYEAATAVIGEPDPSNERLLLFDLREPAPNSKTQLTIEALLDVFREEESETVTSFDLFTQLYRWQQKGIISDVVLAIRKRGVDDLMLYDWLSDGEQLFVGRMSLFHLLQNENDVLFLLDEPETHFNDVWKRRIVDTIDDSMHDSANEVVITTHSSIALTDVFREEITYLRIDEGQTVRDFVPIPTFGADPSEIMVYVFGMPDGMGERALKYLNENLDRDWTVDDLDELETLIRQIGAGFHRSELRAVWRRLNASRN